MIKDIMIEDRPRERLISVGASNLSNEELVAIILKTGTIDTSVKEVSSRLLSSLNNLSDLTNISINKLTEIKGIGKTKAITLIASIELGRRVYFDSKFHTISFLTASDIYEYYKIKLFNKKQEYFYVIYLDNQKNFIVDKNIFVGTVNMSVVHPREVFKEAYMQSASYIICLHNHPSGDPLPSREDINLTSRLKEIGVITAIPLLDHIIIGKDNYYSFYENKML